MVLVKNFIIIYNSLIFIYLLMGLVGREGKGNISTLNYFWCMSYSQNKRLHKNYCWNFMKKDPCEKKVLKYLEYMNKIKNKPNKYRFILYWKGHWANIVFIMSDKIFQK